MDLGRPWVLRGTTLALALVVGAVAWLATRDDDGEAAPAAAGAPRVLAEEELADLGATAAHPVYWAGPPAGGGELEATELPEGAGVQVRYLEEGEEAGADPAGRVAIGSYPVADPRAATAALARRPGALSRRVPGLGEVVANPREGSSAYFADPTGSVQVEVYAPTLARALALLRSGRVRPVA